MNPVIIKQVKMGLLLVNPTIFLFDFEAAKAIRFGSQGTANTNQKVTEEVAYRVSLVAANAGCDKKIVYRGQQRDVSASIKAQRFANRAVPIVVKQISVS